MDKPAGIVVYANRGGGHGMMTVRAAITFAVKPSRPGTYSILRRPQPVHRLDKATSGLLLIAKTKPSMINLSYQFRDRKIKKTYTAIVNGIPPPGDAISAVEAHRLGVDVDPDVNGKDEWQIIDHALDEKSAVTVWKVIKSSKSIHARDNVLTSIELKPKTGRFHQLRRHMSWVLDCPIAGDDKYDGGGDAMRLRGEGLHLCSNKVTLEHPSYNDMEEEGTAIFQQLSEKEKEGLWMSPEGKVMVTACIDIPDKFESFISEENNGGGDAMRLRGEGLHLCSNKVTLEHPSYNDMEEEGTAIFQQLSEKEKEGLWMSPEGKVMVTACIDIPDKFESFISEENNGYIKQTSEEV